MPLYDYRCNKCSKFFEKFAKVDERHQVHCVFCDATHEVEQVILKASNVITDEMPAMMSHVDCKIYTSKSEYHKSLRQNGYEVADPKFLSKEEADKRAEKNIKKYQDETTKVLAEVANSIL